MPILLFDLMSAQHGKGEKSVGGGEEYIKIVLRNLLSLPSAGFSLEVCRDKNKPVDAWIQEELDKKGIRQLHVESVRDVVKVMEEHPERSCMIFYSGLINKYRSVAFPPEVRAIGTFHGLRNIEKPFELNSFKYAESLKDIGMSAAHYIAERFAKKRLISSYARLFENFDTVITVSQHSRYSMHVNFPGLADKKEKIKVFYSPLKYHTMHVRKDDEIPAEEYIMMVSANRWLKNSFRGVKAIDELYSAGQLGGLKTRVYGGLPKRIRQKVKNAQRFEFYDYVSSEELEKAYCYCSIFFYPTLNEGFGYPPLEAMKYGRTCVISAVTSLPEVYGDAAYYCNPYDIMEMKNRLLQAADKKLPEEKIAAQVAKIGAIQEAGLKELISIITDFKKG